MFRRIAARIVTGPVAFFLAAVIDIAVLAVGSLRRRRARREQPGARRKHRL